MYINSELNKDLSEWVTNILFTCKYDKMKDEGNPAARSVSKNGHSEESSKTNGNGIELERDLSQPGEAVKGYLGNSMSTTSQNTQENFSIPATKYKQGIKCDMEIEILE